MIVRMLRNWARWNSVFRQCRNECTLCLMVCILALGKILGDRSKLLICPDNYHHYVGKLRAFHQLTTMNITVISKLYKFHFDG
jgi:hypothetical protein